jgi:hypothetical protein
VKVRFCNALLLEDEIASAILKVSVETAYEKSFDHRVSRSDRVNRILYRYLVEHELIEKVDD